jgi:hypothetical protein
MHETEKLDKLLVLSNRATISYYCKRVVMIAGKICYPASPLTTLQCLTAHHILCCKPVSGDKYIKSSTPR